jgi:phage terminase large subunit-like protein
LDIIQALQDQNVFAPHFKGNSWDAWRVFLAALFGLPLTPDQHLLFKQFTGRTTAPTSPLREAWLVVGRRGGKSFVLAVVAVFLACFKDWKPYLGPGEVGTIMIIAKDRQQARAIKRFISGLLRETPMLAPMIEDETAESIRLRNRIVIEIHTASYRSTRGYTIIAALLDEIAIWESDEFAAEPDVDDAIKPVMLTVPGSVLLCASSPHARRGAYRKH